MAQTKLIAKIKQYSEEKSLVKIKIEGGEFISKPEGVIQSSLYLSNNETDNTLLGMDLPNLDSLIMLGFTIRLGKVDENYTIIIAKGNCSVTYTATKETLIKTLQQADEWAEAFIFELQITNHTL